MSVKQNLNPFSKSLDGITYWPIEKWPPASPNRILGNKVGTRITILADVKDPISLENSRDRTGFVDVQLKMPLKLGCSMQFLMILKTSSKFIHGMY